MAAIYNHLMKQLCNIEQVDQADGSRTVVITDLPCSYPFPYTYRQGMAGTNYDIQLMQVFTAVPENGVIEESMRIRFDEESEYRIHSISKWPMVRPKYIEILLHGPGNG